MGNDVNVCRRGEFDGGYGGRRDDILEGDGGYGGDRYGGDGGYGMCFHLNIKVLPHMRSVILQCTNVQLLTGIYFSIAGPPRGGRMSEREAPLVSTETVFETVLPP